MDGVRVHSYRLSLFFLTASGLWPHRSTLLKHMQKAVFVSTFASAIMFQFVNLMSTEQDMKLFLHNMSFIVVLTGCASKYCTFLIHKENIGEIMRRIKDDWDSITIEVEFQVMRRHALRGRYYTKVFAVMLMQAGFLLVISQYTFVLLDYVIPLNESREPFFLVKLKTFNLVEEHPHIFRIYVSVTIMVCGLTFIGTETLYLMLIQHASSLFDIATYYMKMTFNGKFLKVSEKKPTIDDMLKLAVSKYNHAMEFTMYVVNTFVIGYLVLLPCGMMSLSMNLYRIAIAFPNITAEFITSVSFVVTELGYMYYVNFIMQHITDVCNNIFYEIYDTKWYDLSPSMQKYLLFICLRASKSVVVGVPGIYVGSIKGFSAICKLSQSYFMAMYSIQ